MRRYPTTLLFFFSALIIGLGLSSQAQAGGQLLYHKVVPQALSYKLNITSVSQLDTHYRGGGYVVKRSHEDIMTLNQKVEKTGDGRLDVAYTFKSINPLKKRPFYQGGSEYMRKDIVGAPHHTIIDPLGGVKEIKGVPHFASGLFHNEIDGAPLDLYRTLLFLSPRFPLGLISKGDSWNIEDEIKVQAGEMPAQGGVPARAYEVDVKVKRKVRYSWIDNVTRKGYKTARIGFKASFTLDGEGHSATAGQYTKGLGDSSGEIFFALDEGFVVEAVMTSKVKENKAEDGRTVTMWLTPKERIFLQLEGRTTVPLRWRTDQQLRLELVGGKAAKQ